MILLLQCSEEGSPKYDQMMKKSKTKITIRDHLEKNSPEIREIQSFEMVDQFIYLGSIAENNSGCKAEIRHRAQIITHSAMTRLKGIGVDVD